MPAAEWDELNIDKQAVRHLIMKHGSHVTELAKLKAYYEGLVSYTHLTLPTICSV